MSGYMARWAQTATVMAAVLLTSAVRKYSVELSSGANMTTEMLRQASSKMMSALQDYGAGENVAASSKVVSLSVFVDNIAYNRFSAPTKAKFRGIVAHSISAGSLNIATMQDVSLAVVGASVECTINVVATSSEAAVAAKSILTARNYSMIEFIGLSVRTMYGIGAVSSGAIAMDVVAPPAVERASASVNMRVRVEGVDYDKLIGLPAVDADFRRRIAGGIAAHSDGTVGLDAVNVSVSVASVRCHINVTAANEQDANEMQRNWFFEKESMQEHATGRILELNEIAEASLGTIGVLIDLTPPLVARNANFPASSALDSMSQQYKLVWPVRIENIAYYAMSLLTKVRLAWVMVEEFDMAIGGVLNRDSINVAMSPSAVDWKISIPVPDNEAASVIIDKLTSRSSGLLNLTAANLAMVAYPIGASLGDIRVSVREEAAEAVGPDSGTAVNSTLTASNLLYERFAERPTLEADFVGAVATAVVNVIDGEVAADAVKVVFSPTSVHGDIIADLPNPEVANELRHMLNANITFQDRLVQRVVTLLVLANISLGNISIDVNGTDDGVSTTTGLGGVVSTTTERVGVTTTSEPGDGGSTTTVPGGVVSTTTERVGVNTTSEPGDGVSTTTVPGGVVSTTTEMVGVNTTSEPGDGVSTTTVPGGVVSTTTEMVGVNTTSEPGDGVSTSTVPGGVNTTSEPGDVVGTTTGPGPKSCCEECIRSGQDYCVSTSTCTARVAYSCGASSDQVTGDQAIGQEFDVTMVCPVVNEGVPESSPVPVFDKSFVIVFIGMSLGIIGLLVLVRHDAGVLRRPLDDQ